MIDLTQDVDFKFVDPTEESTIVNVELLTGEFEGVVYRYGRVNVNEDEESGEAMLSYEFDLVDSNGLDSLLENEDFKNHIGHVLSNIMIQNQSVSEEESQIQ